MVEMVSHYLWNLAWHFSYWYIEFYLGLLIYWVKEKWNEEDKEDKQVEYEMKVETTENDIKP